MWSVSVIFRHLVFGLLTTYHTAPVCTARRVKKLEVHTARHSHSRQACVVWRLVFVWFVACAVARVSLGFGLRT